jgi:hypothetical protein
VVLLKLASLKKELKDTFDPSSTLGDTITWLMRGVGKDSTTDVSTLVVRLTVFGDIRCADYLTSSLGEHNTVDDFCGTDFVYFSITKLS